MDICRDRENKKTKKQDETCCLGDGVVIDEVTEGLSGSQSAQVWASPPDS